MTAKPQRTNADVARSIEGHKKHLEFAKQAVEDGWNARNERDRGFHFQAALKTLENVIREQDALTDELYKIKDTSVGGAK